MNKNVKSFIIYFIPVFLLCIFPVIFLYSQNSGEASFKETLFPILCFVGSGFLIYIFSLSIMRSVLKSAFITCVIVFCFTNYTIIEKLVQKIIPFLAYWHIVSILIFLLIHIFYFINKYMSDETAKKLSLILSIVFGGLVLVNLVTAVPTIIKKINVKSEKPSEIVLEKNIIEVKQDMPNIYYIILDEYSSFNSIKEVYGYDNSDFKDFLINKKFTVSDDSHNESIYTSTVTGNILNLDYVVNDHMYEEEKNSYRTNSKAFELLRDYGYKINVANVETLQLNAEYSFNDKDKQSSTIDGANLTNIILQNTILYPTTYINESSTRDIILDGFEYLNNSYSLQKNNLFTWAHILFPHQPFQFDENGKPVPLIKKNDWDDKDVYLGQYKYCTTLIMDTINKLIENDPNCIIILQSDHSARGNINIESKYKNSILNAVYFQGDFIEDINSQSGLNTFRIVLNKVLNINLPVLEVPDYEE